jgi:hypothetical protein
MCSGRRCVYAAVEIVIFCFLCSVSVADVEQWSQPPIEIPPMGPEPNFLGIGLRAIRDVNYPPVWFNEWNRSKQCHGDADGKTTGFPMFYRVYLGDMDILVNAWDTAYPFSGPNEPNADFTRDGRVDFLDLLEVGRWWKGTDTYVPANCVAAHPWAIMLADDFRWQNGRPITSVQWWGSYRHWDEANVPSVQPDSWQIGLWDNIPDPNPSDSYTHWTYGRPDKLLRKISIPASRVNVQLSGQVGDWQWWWLSVPESVFSHTVSLATEEYLWPGDFNSQGDCYWLSILPVYPPDANLRNPWGWHIRPWHWQESAIMTRLYAEPQPGDSMDANWTLPVYDYSALVLGGNNEPCDSWDMTFTLLTDANLFKWQQPYTGIRDWPSYEDIGSRVNSSGAGILAADDWLCEKRTPVVGIIWWGSYIGARYNCMKKMQPPINKPDYFLLSIWTNQDANEPGNPYSFNHPQQLIWQFRANSYDEVMAGYDRFPDSNLDPCEPVFRYSVEIPEPNWFYQHEVNGIYWLSIAAVFQGSEPNYPWGWTNHPYGFGGQAVVGILPQRLWNPASVPGVDTSFMLLTDPNMRWFFPDFTYDCRVDWFDLDAFVNQWLWFGYPNQDNTADMDFNGKVDFYDLAVFAQYWLLVDLDSAICADFDGDGYGWPGSYCCLHPEPDCNDADQAVHPYATEICNNGKDDDCDGLIDYNDPDCN